MIESVTIDTRDPSSSYIEQRRKICYSCEHLTSMMTIKICGKCGCAVIPKTTIAFAECPIDKWGKFRGE